MPSIFGALNLGQQGLEVNQYALELTQRNIANVNTPGYSRQRVNLIPGEVDSGGGGMAVTVGPVDTFRDRFLDYRIASELGEQGKSEAESSTLGQIEALLNETGGEGLQSALSSFFNSLSALAAAPEDMNLRSQVLGNASDLARNIRRLADRLHALQYSQDEAVKGTVDHINELTSRIASLNAQISGSPDTTGNTAMLRDQRQQALEQLSSLVDLSYFETESGAVSVSTGNGALLVVGDQTYTMKTVPSSSLLQVEIDGRNLTSQIEGGRLGGILSVRDSKLPAYLGQLDELAGGLVERVNAVHAGGDDYNGTAGGDFFVPLNPSVPGSFAGAAGSIAVAITDPRKIAAAAVGAGPGSNDNALKLAALLNDRLFESGTTTPIDFYSRLVFSVASDSSSAFESSNTQRHILTQLQNQRDAASGVSLDEEAANLIRFQKAFEASARFIQAVNEMTDALVKMLG